MKKIVFLLTLLPLSLFAQRYKEQINFYNPGDQAMALGRYQIGSAVRIECQISGSYAQDGGIYHIVSDWNNTPKVALRSESSISERLKFHSYVDPNSSGYAFLFATWDNQSQNEASGNDAKFTIYSEGSIDVNNLGSFASASELENILIIQSTTGKVGIGTATPLDKLHIFNSESGGSSHSFSDLLIEDNDTGMVEILTSNTGTGYYGFADNDDSFVGGIQYEHTNDRMLFRVNDHSHDLTIYNNGYVGIGTTTPNAHLELSKGDGTSFRLSRTGGHGQLASLGQIEFYEGNYDNAVSSKIEGTRGPGAAGRGELAFSTLESTGTSLIERMRITYTGKVGIGTSTPDEKLTVKGTIHTEEVKVDLNVPGPDYVFEPGYDLRSLEETEKYIQENKHLPEIPSAKEMEANGVMLGEMNMLLLKKIEELTLYQIELMKRLESAEQKIKQLEGR